ncbi:hypothetical protein pdam_00020636, partial [Pocillopora damicornis]
MMRISSQLLRSRTSQPLQLVEYLDLSNLGLVSLERLELCPKVQTLIVRGNRIEAVPDLRCYSQLWKIDLANNVVKSLEGLFSVAAFGTLVLANNDLDWNELQKIRHVHILDLSLHGNHKLEMDAYSAERAQVEQFFKDSALSDRPVRHKLPKNHFVPSSLKNISLTGVFGQKASLEFAIPSLLVQQTLDIARLRKIRNVDTMDVFMLPRDVRCRLISLLLGAVKIERDQHIDGGLYNRLYLCLYDLVADLVRLANGDSIAKYQATRKRLDSRKAGYRCLLASEVVQLLCIVPVFFDFIGKDPGVLDLIIVATKDEMIGEKIKSLSWKIQSEGSKRLLKASHERPHSCKGSVWSKLQSYAKLGILNELHTYGRLVALPESDMGLVQLETVAVNDKNLSSAPKFQQADYPINYLDQQFLYVDFADINWDCASETWRPSHSKEFAESRSQKGSRSKTLNTSYDNREEVAQFLSDAIRQNLQLRVDLPAAYNTDATSAIGEPVATDSKLIAVMVVCKSKKLCTKSKIMDVTITKDSESERLKEIEENFLLMEDEGDDIALDDLGSESAQYFPVDSEGMEEMVSYTEHARINAWKTPEVIKKATEKGVPSRVGSATTRVNSISAAHPPPQRPSSPTQPGVVPFIQANRWQISSPITSRTRVSRPTTGRPLGQSGQFIMRGSSHVQYQFQPTR